MYLVRCMSELGTTVDVRVSGHTTCEQASRAALRTLPSDYRAVWALEA